jgi:outer membrane lipoprotein SlyB
MKKPQSLFLLLAFSLIGCTTTQKGAAVGGVGGATLGGIIGHQSGDGVKGAAIGGALGTVAGMVVGEKMEKKFCPVCGAEYTEDVKFCSKDGTELKLKQ